MTAITDKLESNLHQIVHKTEDAIMGYERAAKNASVVGLKEYFQNKAKERLNFVASLKAALPTMNLRGSKTGINLTEDMDATRTDSGANREINSDKALLEEAMNVEKVAVEQYEKMLDNPEMPESAVAIIRQQIKWIKEDIKTIKTMEDVR